MAIEVQGRVGPIVAQDGTLQDPRLLKDASLAVSDSHARYYESNYRGNIYTASVPAAGVAPGTALGTTPPFTLYNPTGSPVNLAVLEASYGYISGTYGIVSIVFCWNPQTTSANPTGGTVIAPRSCRVGSPTQGQGLAFSGSTVASTSQMLRPFLSIGVPLATTAGFPVPPIMDISDAKFIVLPGNCLSIQGVGAAGTSPLCLLGMVWEEIPV